MKPYAVALGTLLSVWVAASGAGAQVLQPPTRPLRGLFGGSAQADPNRTHQAFELQGNLLGGYDDNLSLPGVGGDIFAPRPSGTIGFADLGGRYSVGGLRHSLEVNGRGFMNSFGNVGLGPTVGANENLVLRTGLGRRTSLQVTQSVSFLPYFTLGLFAPLNDPTAPLSSNADANPTNALATTRSWATDATATLTRTLTRRLRLDAGYGFNKRTYTTGAGFDSQDRTLSLGLTRALGRTTSLRAGYRHQLNRVMELDGVPRPIVNDTIDGGFEYQRNLSRTRRMAFSGGLGAVHLDTVEPLSRRPTEYWSPTGYGTARVDIGRSWSMSADYRRAQTLLQGLIAQSFVTHSAMLSSGGFINSRVESVVSLAYSNGQTNESAELAAVGEYDGYTAAVQFRFLLMRGWSAIAGYNRYQYLLNEAARRPLQVAPELQRNSVRVGLSWTLPLYGASSGTRVAPPQLP